MTCGPQIGQFLVPCFLNMAQRRMDKDQVPGFSCSWHSPDRLFNGTGLARMGMWILWSLPGSSTTEMGNEIVASLCALETTGGKHKELLCLKSGQQALHGCVVVVGGSLPSGNTLQDFLGPLKFP